MSKRMRTTNIRNIGFIEANGVVSPTLRFSSGVENKQVVVHLDVYDMQGLCREMRSWQRRLRKEADRAGLELKGEA